MASFVSKSTGSPRVATMIFGRFQPPHKSHGELIDLVIEKAIQVGGTAFVFTSKKSNDFNDPSKLKKYIKTKSKKNKKRLSENPIKIRDKLNLLNSMHGHKPIVIVDVEKENISSPYHALNWLISHGFNYVYLFAGTDRVESYKVMAHNISQKALPNIITIKIVELTRNNEAVSGTRVRNAALETSLSDVINTAKMYSDIYGRDKCLDKINEIIRIIDLIQKGTVLPNTPNLPNETNPTKTLIGGRNKKKKTRKKRMRKNKKTFKFKK